MATLRDTVRVNHFQDVEHAETFIETTWGPSGGRPVDENFVCYTISTTEHSTILILSLGIESAFTWNTFSAIKDQPCPWLAYLHPYVNGKLAQHIRITWQGMIQHLSEDQQQAVNQIAKHVIYQYVGGIFVPVMLEFDADNNVRARIEDINIWSHPPRDEPLRRVLEEIHPNLRQVEGNITHEAKVYLKMRNGPEISDEKKRKTKRQLQHTFSKLYSLYQDLDTGKRKIPDSYKWPTLQLEKNDSYPKPPQQPSQHYGDTYAGFHGPTANEAHNKFPAEGVEARVFILPSQEDVFNQLMAKKDIALQYADISP